MINRITSSCAAALALMVVVGCSSFSKRLNRLELGMTQPQAKKILGDEYVVKASRVDTDGSTLQLWQFRDKKTEESYNLYFKDGVLAQWGLPTKQDFPDLIMPKR